ncbi:MAG TPA: hypothetical protein VMP86_02825 [Candidatus Binatia bacterium]|nr:hypothetical protein [Candidatus Binatia bacterium]
MHLSLRRSAPLVIITLSMLLALVAAAPVAAKKNPPGNNGTVKIDGLPFDNHPNNEPHVGCRFEVDFYGFNEGDLWADVTFEAQPPTGRGILLTDSVFIGHDDNSGGGSEAGWDASAEYDLTQALSAYAVHAQQGYHVKLTINADGSQGADKKHKVFWVGPCQTNVVPPSTPPSTPPSNPPGEGVEGSSSSPSDPPRQGTAGGSGGPSVGTLPNTALTVPSASGLLLAGLVLLSGATIALVAARSALRR